MRRLLICMLALLLLTSSAVLAQDALLGVQTLIPTACSPIEAGPAIPLYCGPTQGFYRHEEQALDLSKPYVFFGQYDCWAMASQGTPDAFGPVGWVEAALLSPLPDAPELSFADSLAAMVEEDAPMTNDPLSADAAWAASLPRGEQVTVLAAYGDWLYVQTVVGGVPARVFLPASAIL